MANEQNLVQNRKTTPTERRNNAIKAGKASGEARRRRKTLKEELLLLLSQGEIQESMTLALIEKAKGGDTKAFEVIRDTIGEKPVDKVQMKTDVNIADSAERLSNIFEQIKEEK